MSSVDLKNDTTSMCLTVIIPKHAGEVFVADFLRRVSRAFAETERVSVDGMHEVLESLVQGFEDDSQFKFVWERSLTGKGNYLQLLSVNLTKHLPSRHARQLIPR
jgi:hypothetical protein